MSKNVEDKISPKIAEFIADDLGNIQTVLTQLEQDRITLTRALPRKYIYIWVCVAALSLIVLIAGMWPLILIFVILGFAIAEILNGRAHQFSRQVHIALLQYIVESLGWRYSPLYAQFPEAPLQSIAHLFNDNDNLSIRKWGLYSIGKPHKHLIQGRHHGLLFNAAITFSDIFKSKKLATEQEKPEGEFFTIIVELPIAFQTTTLVLRDRNDKKIGPKKLKRVNIVSSDFERRFDVYSTDQTEARYILDPEVIARLEALDNLSHGRALEIVFDQNKAILLLGTRYDLDYPNIHMSFLDVAYTARIFKELSLILTAIDAIVWSAAHQIDYKSNSPTMGT